jgi:hypothetical protein
MYDYQLHMGVQPFKDMPDDEASFSRSLLSGHLAMLLA